MTAKMLKLINFRTKSMIIITNDVCQKYSEKDEKLEHLLRSVGSERLSAENLGSGYVTFSARRARAVKKRLPHPPCGRPETAPHQALRGTPRTDPLTIYQSVGRKPDPNCRAFSCGPHSRWASVSCAGFHSGGKLLGRRCWRSSLHPPLAMIVAQHDGAVEQGEADPQAVGRDQ